LPVPNKPRSLSPGEEENSLNEEWYVSYITRPEAEAALRKINQDGTFLVRDSSKKTIANPYVLMVLYKDKVYNIQIRYQEESQVYLLGTGLRGKEVRNSSCKISPNPLFMPFHILANMKPCCNILWEGPYYMATFELNHISEALPLLEGNK